MDTRAKDDARLAQVGLVLFSTTVDRLPALFATLPVLSPFRDGMRGLAGAYLEADVATRGPEGWSFDKGRMEALPPAEVYGLALATSGAVRSGGAPRVRAALRAHGCADVADTLSLELGREKVRQRAASKDLGAAASLMDMKATMYFAYGADKREGVQARTTFDAIVSGERTSTTRFDVWPGADKWGKMEPGALVRFFEDKEMKGRFVDVMVDSVTRVDLSKASSADLEAWSQVEGWSAAHGRKIASRGPGFQVRYHALEGESARLVSREAPERGGSSGGWVSKVAKAQGRER